MVQLAGSNSSSIDMATTNIAKLLKETSDRLKSCEVKFVKLDPELAKTLRVLKEANKESNRAKTELYRDRLESLQPELNSGAKDVKLARESFDELRMDKQAEKENFKQLDALATRLDKIEKLYEERVDDVDDTLVQVGIDLQRMLKSSKSLELDTSALKAEFDDFQKNLQGMERSVLALNDQAETAAKTRDAKGVDRVLQQTKRLGVSQARGHLQKLELRLHDLEARVGTTNIPGGRDREYMRRDLRAIEPRLEKLEECVSDLMELQVPEIDDRAAAKALEITDSGEIKQLKAILGGPDLPRALDPLARKHGSTGKEWVKRLERARLL